LQKLHFARQNGTDTYTPRLWFTSTGLFFHADCDPHSHILLQHLSGSCRFLDRVDQEEL